MDLIKFRLGKPTKKSLELFQIDCTGDCCAGDVILFEKALYDGGFSKGGRPKYVGREKIIAQIISESYGKKRQQHTFVLRPYWSDISGVDNLREFKIKGRNLYRFGVMRMKWLNEEERMYVLADKHRRGNEARSDKMERRFRYGFE